MAYICNDVFKAPAAHLNLVGHRIDQGRLEFIRVLGLGAYGVVYLAQDLTSPDSKHPALFAVKVLNKIGLDARQKSFQRREIALHSLASSHPSVVTLHAVIESPSCIFVVLDYCPDGDLFGMITEKKKYIGKTEAIKSVFIQIIEAVEFCHCLGISHRDLKPENILCKEDGNAVVLADFGLATCEAKSSDFGCGSTFYMSPECQGGLLERISSYSTFQNDIWSLGVILVNLTCGRNPWKQASRSDETFRAYLANPDFLRSILPISQSCSSLLQRVFSPDPLGRISLKDLKIEISRIETFDMSWSELSRATKATKEAASAWRNNVVFSSPKVQQPSPKLSLSKCNVNCQHSPCCVRTHRPIVRKPEQTDAPQVDQGNYGVLCTADSVVLTSVLSTHAHQDESKSSKLDNPCAHVIPPNRPLQSSFVSNSSPCQSSPSSDLNSRRRGVFAGRFKSSLSKEGPLPPSRRNNIASPTIFRRPNAPCPIIVNRTTPSKAASDVSLTPKPLIASPRKGFLLNFLPFTPPASASPSKPTFGIGSRPSRFFHLCSNPNQALPPTPSTPNQRAHFAPSSSPSPSALV